MSSAYPWFRRTVEVYGKDQIVPLTVKVPLGRIYPSPRVVSVCICVCLSVVRGGVRRVSRVLIDDHFLDFLRASAGEPVFRQQAYDRLQRCAANAFDVYRPWSCTKASHGRRNVHVFEP